MGSNVQIGIHGVGIYLPEQVRKNDWWPDAIVDGWRQNQQKKVLTRAVQDQADPPTAGVQATFDALKEYADDPFKGAVERRVMPAGMRSSDMEIAAAKDALARSGTSPSEVDLLLVYSTVPDQLTISNATLIHRELGLPTRCLSMGTEGACNSFLQQMAMAQALIRDGRAKKALLIQSNALLHICRAEDPHSAWFGDAATAVVAGPVSGGRGVLGQAHFTDGSFHEALQSGCPNSPEWWRGEPIWLYVRDRDQSRKMLMVIADLAKSAVDGALADAGLPHDAVDFYATHQSTAWFRKATQQYIGLANARSFDSFAWTGSLSGSNIPFMMGMAEREGQLREGDLVAMYTGGSGVVWSGLALRWGR